jgi:hypothetical protein
MRHMSDSTAMPERLSDLSCTIPRKPQGLYLLMCLLACAPCYTRSTIPVSRMPVSRQAPPRPRPRDGLSVLVLEPYQPRRLYGGGVGGGG